jgi:hypothetical protein
VTWFKVDDSFYDHLKVFDAPDCAVALWVRAGAWAARNLTDGFVPSGMPARLCDDADNAVKELVRRKLWSRVKDGYRFHDWTKYQPTRESVEHEREAATERKRRERDRRKSEKAQVNTPAVTDTSRRDAPVTAGVTHGAVTAPRPDPTTSSNEEVLGSPAAPPGIEDDRTKNGTRIPDDFQVTPAMVEWAKRVCPDIDGRSETAKFINYWQAKPGKDGLKLSWNRTWQNWMRTAQERRTQPRQNGSLGSFGAESNAPKNYKAGLRCELHPSQPKNTCGSCRAEQLAAGRPATTRRAS